MCHCEKKSTMRQLVGSGWGADTKTLCTATLSLINSTADYCASVWCSSTHTCIDKVLNDTLGIVTGCIAIHTHDHYQA